MGTIRAQLRLCLVAPCAPSLSHLANWLLPFAAAGNMCGANQSYRFGDKNGGEALKPRPLW